MVAAQVRICLGHYATASHEPPPANSKHVKVLEVTDTDVGPLGGHLWFNWKVDDAGEPPRRCSDNERVDLTTRMWI